MAINFPEGTQNLPAQIVQVVQTVKTDTFTTTTNGYTDVTGLSVNITPNSTSSKILVMTSVNFSHSHGSRCVTRVVRRENSTDSVISQGDAAGNRVQGMMFGRHVEVNGATIPMSIQILDSPSTTNALTYKFQVGRIDASTLAINMGRNDANESTHARGISTITVMEVAS